jgi:hypothetical protein
VLTIGAALKPSYTTEQDHRNVLTVRMDVPATGWEQWFLLRTDVHHDNPKCDQKLERKHLDQAVERGAGIIDNGDNFCAMQGKYDKRSDKNAMRPEHQKGNYLDMLVNTAAEFYGPYAKNWLLMGQGNHETGILKNHETNLNERLVERLNTQQKTSVSLGGYGGWVRFLFTIRKTRKDSRLLHHFHGTGGGGPVTRGVIQTNRMAVFNPDADVIFTGHTHDEWIVPIARQRVSTGGVPYHDEQIHVRAPGYKDAWGDGYAGWECEKGLGPKPKGAAWLRFFLESDKIQTEVTRAK